MMPPRRSTPVRQRARHVTGRGVTARQDFSTTLNLQSDLGVDPSANADITDTLEDALDDGTLIEIPSGRYALRDFRIQDRVNAGIRGVGNEAPQLVLPDNPGKYWIRMDDVRDFVFENLVLDQTQSGASGTVRVQAEGDVTLRDIVKHGIHDSGDGDAGFKLTAQDNDATMVAERLVADPITDPNADGRNGNYTAGRVQGFFVPSNHSGTIEIRDCRMTHASDNGLYGQPPAGDGGGAVNVIGGFYANNNISNVRIGSDGSSVRGVTVVNDARAPDAGEGHGQRGIWVRAGGDNLIVQNNDVSMIDGNLGHAINMGENAAGSSGEVINNRIRNEGGRAAMNVHPNVRDNWSGRGNHLSGGGNLSAPDAWVACRGSGCDEPGSGDSQNCQGVTCPPGQTCDPATGNCVSSGSGGGGGDLGRLAILGLGAYAAYRYFI